MTVVYRTTMTRPFLALLLFALPVSCAYPSGDAQAQEQEQAPESEAANPRGPEWKAPVHPQPEFYTHNYSAGGTVGVWGRRGVFDSASTSPGGKSGASCGSPGEVPHGSESEYLGTLDGADYYEVTVSYPSEGGSTSFTQTFQYKGVDLEFWSDDDWRIGMRPYEGDDEDD